jgi:hypothetical protein
MNKIGLEGENSFYNLDINLQVVNPELSPTTIWRNGGGPFSDCDCEDSVDEMYRFVFHENDKN